MISHIETINAIRERVKLIKDYHGPENGHLGINKTVEKMSYRFYWENMKKDIENYIKTCKDCQLTKRA